MTENVLRERKKLEACIQSWESQIKVQEMKLKALEDVSENSERT
uniref:Uncharacterized protein n=1 Tax=Anguilla anguilla TaxID=7936 RepID=A0A0E9SEX1_ANGAN